jgi:hypothetical protein
VCQPTDENSSFVQVIANISDRFVCGYLCYQVSTRVTFFSAQFTVMYHLSSLDNIWHTLLTHSVSKILLIIKNKIRFRTVAV